MDDTPTLPTTLAELAAAFLSGACLIAGARLADKLADPYSGPRLTVAGWLDTLRGGDTP